MNITERLEEMLDEKDSKIHELEAQIEALENDLRGIQSGWTRHRKLSEKQVLPVPRLELTWTETDEGQEATYCLVYRHLLGHCMAIPVGHTLRQGGYAGPPIRNGRIDLPFRDGVHIRQEARSLNLPAFVTMGELTQKIDLEDSKP